MEAESVACRGRVSERILANLGQAIADAQLALLAGRVCDLEACLVGQKKLCREFDLSLREPGKPADMSLREMAYAVREQNQLFAATLQRMRRNLALWQRAMACPQPTYQPPAAARKR